MPRTNGNDHDDPPNDSKPSDADRILEALARILLTMQLAGLGDGGLAATQAAGFRAYNACQHLIAELKSVPALRPQPSREATEARRASIERLKSAVFQAESLAREIEKMIAEDREIFGY